MTSWGIYDTTISDYLRSITYYNRLSDDPCRQLAAGQYYLVTTGTTSSDTSTDHVQLYTSSDSRNGLWIAMRMNGTTTYWNLNNDGHIYFGGNKLV